MSAPRGRLVWPWWAASPSWVVDQPPSWTSESHTSASDVMLRPAAQTERLTGGEGEGE